MSGGMTEGGAMGESYLQENINSDISQQLKDFIIQNKDLINDEKWDELFLKVHETLSWQDSFKLCHILESIGCEL